MDQLGFDGISTIDNVLHSEAQLLFADTANTEEDASLYLPLEHQHSTHTLPSTISTVHDTVLLESDIRTSIKLREEYLVRLQRLVQDASPTDLQKNLLDIIGVMDLLRTVTVDVVASIVRWRRGLPKPFPWKGPRSSTTSYLIKMSSDTDFLATQTILEQWLGFTLSHNPFFALNYKGRLKAKEEKVQRKQQFNFAKEEKKVLEHSTAARTCRRLLLANMNEDQLQGAEDAIRREEIHNGMILRGEIGGVVLQTEEEKEGTATRPEDTVDNTDFDLHVDQGTAHKNAAAQLAAAEVLLANRVRRKLSIVSKRPKLRKRLIAIALTSEQQPLKAGSKRARSKKRKSEVYQGGMATKELRSLLFQQTGEWCPISISPHLFFFFNRFLLYRF
jgi:hypothetical protein